LHVLHWGQYIITTNVKPTDLLCHKVVAVIRPGHICEKNFKEVPKVNFFRHVKNFMVQTYS